MRHYVVRPGDTLAKIANEFGVNWRDLLKANPHATFTPGDPTTLRPGVVLHVLGVDPLEKRVEALEQAVWPPPGEEPPDGGGDPGDPGGGDDEEPPVDPNFPEPFMSYESSGPIILDGESGVTIEGYSFDNLTWPDRPITLMNCSDITIRYCDSRRCSMGIVYAVNCHDITVEYCRVENITGPYERTGANRANFYQFNNVDGFYCHHLKGRYGDTEDVFSHYASKNGVLEDVAWEGAVDYDQPTSDGSPSIPWRSPSGTGAICGDGGGANVIIRRATFLNPGQVGLAIAGGTNCGFEDCVVVSTQWPVTRPSGGSGNVGAYVWNQYPYGCSGHHLTGCRVRFHNGNHWWNGGNCGAIDRSGSVFGDLTLNPEDYRVVL
ncbi:MAG TPA: right-handed parallel beta-helix repeat-containing protein [Acidimicrobiia bacterium]